ncbi:MAG: biopolymer transporter ExbD [Rhodospirillales bacterium]
MAFGKPRRRPSDEDQRILPLINVVFLLLIFFMVAGQLSKTDRIRIDPPVSDSKKEAAEPPLQILIAPDGRIVLGGEDIALDALSGKLRQMSDTHAGTVHVKADGAVDAVTVIGVLDRIKAGGATKVNLLTSARKGP